MENNTTVSDPTYIVKKPANNNDDAINRDNQNEAGDLHPAEIVYLVLVAILVCVEVAIFMTCLSRKARGRSASWYMYHTTFTVILVGFVVVPMGHSGRLTDEIECRVYEFFIRVLGLVRPATMVLLNLETMFTVLLPKASWVKTRKKRFNVSLGFVWLCYIILILTLREYTDEKSFCLTFGAETEISLVVLEKWLPGALVLCFTVASIAVYVKTRRTGRVSFDFVTDKSAEAIRMHEWFIGILFMNILFLITEPLSILLVEHVYTASIVKLSRLTLFLMPLGMLALSPVRAALRPSNVIAACKDLVKRRRSNSVASEGEAMVSVGTNDNQSTDS